MGQKPHKIESNQEADKSFRGLVRPTLIFYGVVILVVYLGSFIPWDALVSE